MRLIGLITGDINLHHLVKVISARFLHYKVTKFPFVANNYLRGDTLRLCKLFKLKFLPTIFSTHWWILSATIIYSGVCLMVIFFPPFPASLLIGSLL